MRILIAVVVLLVVLAVVFASYDHGRGRGKGRGQGRHRSSGSRGSRDRRDRRGRRRSQGRGRLNPDWHRNLRDFTFGAATDAYGSEGAWNEDNKAPSVWDNGTHTIPGLVVDGSNGDVAADSYHKYLDDVAAGSSICAGHQLIQFSWARILPDPYKDQPEPAAVEFYNNYINALCAAGIEPVVAMTEADVPEIIQRIGGYANEKIVALFELYADVCFKLFGDRVKKWITINSANALCNLAYGNPNLWPVVQPISGISEYKCSNNVLKAHACAYELYHRRYAKKFKGKVGIGLYSKFFYPNPDNGTAEDAAKAIDFELGWCLHPLLGKGCGYPPVMLESVARLSKEQNYTTSRLEDFSPYWKKKICGSTDFVGLFYWTSKQVRYTATPDPYTTNYASVFYTPDAELEYTDDPNAIQGDFYAIVPEGFRAIFKHIKDNYGNCPVFITGNGLQTLSDRLDDVDAADYLEAHVEQMGLAVVEDGCNVCGYTVWALIDLFEYHLGYTAHSGLYYVDFNDPERPRTLRFSGAWFRDNLGRCNGTRRHGRRNY